MLPDGSCLDAETWNPGWNMIVIRLSIIGAPID
jgi:hypothetical protein